MKNVIINALAGLGCILLFFIVYSMFNKDTIITFQNKSNYSLFYFFLATIISGILYQIFLKMKK